MPTITRRRGAALDAAILDAAWELLLEAGYEGLTFEAVAARASTSRSVLYRRWDDRPALLLAALDRRGSAFAESLPDTGDLRGDLLATLVDLGSRRHSEMLVLVTRLDAFYRETGSTPRELRERLVAGRGDTMRRIVDRAAARGEVDPARVTDRVAVVGADLVRHELMLTLAPVSAATVTRIVDEVVLPLLGVDPPG